MIYPDPEKQGGRGHKGKASETNGFSQVRLREARQIVPYRDLADQVLAGKLKFDHALKQANDRTEMQTNADRIVSGSGRKRRDRLKCMRQRSPAIDPSGSCSGCIAQGEVKRHDKPLAPDPNFLVDPEGFTRTLVGMAGVLQVEFARKGGVSKQAITKALRAGKLVRGPTGGIDPAHPVNAAWLALHRDDFDSRGREMATHSHAGRPPATEPAGVAKAGPRRSRAGTGNGRLAASAAAFDDGSVDLAQLAAELRLDELSSGAALDDELHRLQVSGGALLDLDRLLGNIAKSIADGLNDGHGRLAAVLLSIDQRLATFERYAAGNDGAAALARFDSLAEILAEMRRGLFQAADGRLLSEAVTGVRDDVAQLRRLLADLVKSLIARCGS